MILAFLPYFLILGGFLGGAQLAMDATAGERERQSLEPLLATPAARGAIMSGKLAAASVFALITTMQSLLAFKFAFALVPASLLGFKVQLGAVTVLQMFAVIVPISVFGSCLVTLLSANAKSMKEAQSYMTLLMLLPMIPSMILIVSPVKNQLWMMAVPLLSQNQMIMKLIRHEPISGNEWAVCLSVDSYEPKEYSAVDSVVVFESSIGLFNAFYQGKVYLLDNIVPEKYEIANGHVAWLDRNKWLQVFHNGKVINVTKEEVTDITLDGNLVRFTAGANDTKIWWDGVLY